MPTRGLLRPTRAEIAKERDRYQQTLELLADTASDDRTRRIARRALDGLPIAGKVTDADLERGQELVKKNGW